MATYQSIADWHGKDLIDSFGEKIGKLQDVYVDVETDKPMFGTVKEGFVRHHLTFVPLAGVSLGPDSLQVAVSREQVRSAPNIEMHGDELSRPTNRPSTTTTSSTTPRRKRRAVAGSPAADGRLPTPDERLPPLPEPLTTPASDSEKTRDKRPQPSPEGKRNRLRQSRQKPFRRLRRANCVTRRRGARRARGAEAPFHRRGRGHPAGDGSAPGDRDLLLHDAHRGGLAGQSARPSRRQPLCPPRPIALESATSISHSRASLGT
jgi:PRC-barrel domain